MGLVLGATDESDPIADGVAVGSPSISINEEELVGVPPHTLADLQAQGRASATTAKTGVDEADITADVMGRPESRMAKDTEALICAYSWPQGCAYWTGIARCESTLGQDPSAYADSNPYVGLLQIWVGHGYGREWLKVDANNVLAAWELSHEGTRTSLWPYCQWQ
ncbi:hypothetical protein LCGC14_2568360 [marine sediment metagenome]|uniref:Uncharacterized protein n=1 Tax=marine sediment metagenome TaxID=412755 RepID=A0A0F9AHZ7_9ZZZZ